MYLFNLTIEYRVIIGISAMVLLFAGFLISFITSQRKKLQYHKDLQLLNDQQQKSLLEQNNLLEQRVRNRTTELSQQKEVLQNSLTELKATQMQLIQREKMASLGELTAGIAHEIQNPLNFVNNFSELSTELLAELKEEISVGNRVNSLAIADDLTHNLQKITHHGGRASSIVKGMLEHSRTSTGERQPTNLNALANEYLRLAYQGLRTKDKNFNCELVTDFDPVLGEVDVVSQDIGRVFLNLYNNGFYAVRQRSMDMKAGTAYVPTVWVSTQRKNKRVQIRIKDNGTGIPESVKNKIFQPFFTTKPTGEGTGLGLSLSYDIVTQGHGGVLTVESTEGEGAEFIITLPTGQDAL
jgi:two-component system, NtrC family, sensor kinase